MQRTVATFYIGHNVKGEPTWSHAKVVHALEAAFPDGFTAWEATGAWLGGRERTTVCQVVDLSPLKASAARELLEFAFRQEKVLCTVASVELA